MVCNNLIYLCYLFIPPPSCNLIACLTWDKIELCPLLSLALPEYRLLPSDLSLPNLYSGGAYFPTSTPPGLLPTLGPIGSVKDINGKKAAKDQCAKGVLEFLTDWMKIQDESIAMDKENPGDKTFVAGDEKEGED